MTLVKCAVSSLLLPLIFASCTPLGSTERTTVASEAAPSDCPLPAGKYDLQNVTFHNGRGEYELFVLGAPSCVRQPVALEKVQLARIETADKKAAAKLEVPSGGVDPVIHLTEDFKIEMINAVVENGEVVKEESSSWMPFLAGAAGAAAIGMAANAMFNRPKYYQPPPPRPGMAEVRGYGASATTHQGALSGYQSKYSTPPPSVANKGFFRKKSDLAASSPRQPQKVQESGSASRPKESRPRKSFFGRRRR
jgi:hypothetical protein